MYVTRKSNCILCEKSFEWWLHVIEDKDEIPETPPGVQADTFYFTGDAMASYGRKIHYDVIVTCPHCFNKNKYGGTLSLP